MNMLAPRLDFTPLTDHQEKLQLNANGNVNIDVISYSCGYEWRCIDREYCRFNLCPVNTNMQVSLNER